MSFAELQNCFIYFINLDFLGPLMCPISYAPNSASAPPTTETHIFRLQY